MRIFDNFIPGGDIWKERVNCGLCGTINITTWNNINIDEYAVDVRILTIFSDSLNPDV